MEEDIATISKRIADRSEDIRAALPAEVRDSVRTNEWGAFISNVRKAVEFYLARATAPRRRREHRATAKQKHPAAAHRPADISRRGLIAELFDQYMTLRADNLEARGFTRVADTIFEAAGLAERVTDRDQATLRRALRQQIAAFAKLAEGNDEPE